MSVSKRTPLVVDVSVTKKQIKASWKKGGQIAKFNRYENADELTGFFISEIARVWAAKRKVSLSFASR
jgi:hypothetical protein